MVTAGGAKLRKWKKWLKQTSFVKILNKMKFAKNRSRSAITMSNTEIFITDRERKTHPEGIYDVIDDFVTSYNSHRKDEFYLVNHLKVAEPKDDKTIPRITTSLPPTLPRKNIWSNPPARPPAHPCTVRCHCVTSL